MKKIILVPLMAAALVLPACSSETVEVEGETVEVQSTLVDVLEDTGGISTLSSAIESAGLNTLFEAPGASYTILAPNDEAFAALDGTGDMPPAVLAAIAREHILPGHLEKSAILDAINANEGKVTMATVGNGTIAFTLDGEELVATHSGGKTGRVVDGGGIAENGTILRMDAVLVTPPTEG